MGYDNATLVSLLLDADEKMGGGTYYQEAADAITALQARVAEQLAHVVRAEAAYTRTQQVLDETVESMGNTIIRLEADIAAARARLDSVAERDRLAIAAVEGVQQMRIDLAAARAIPREPTAQMVQSALSTVVAENGGLEWSIAAAWRAMYDAALAGKDAT